MSVWTMWQHTDGVMGPEPRETDGIGNCDRDKFNGKLDALKSLWIIAAFFHFFDSAIIGRLNRISFSK